MSFRGGLFQSRVTLVTLAIVGVVSGYGWTQYRPEVRTFEIELVPVSPAKIDELTPTIIIDHFKLLLKTDVAEEKTDAKRDDFLSGKIKYFLTSQSQRKKFLSEIPIGEETCATAAINSIQIFQFDTQVLRFPSYWVSVTATCPTVSTCLNGFVETLKIGIFGEIVRTELTRIIDESIMHYNEKRRVLEQLKGLSGALTNKDWVKLTRSFENIDESFLKYEYAAAEKVFIREIDEKV